MSCVVRSTGQMQYKVDDLLLALPPEHKPQELSCIITLLIGLLGLLVYLAGAKCVEDKTCVEDKDSKS